MELNDNASELKHSFAELLVTIYPKRAARSCSACDAVCSFAIQSGDQYFEMLCKFVNLRLRKGGTPTCKSGALPKRAGRCTSPPEAQIREFTQTLEVLAAQLDAKLQTASHAEQEHNLAAHFGCDGDKNLPDAVCQLTDIVILLHGPVLSHACS